jgi:hypothetical protein
MATFEARIEGMTQIAIEETGTAPTQGQITQFLDEGIKDFTNKVISLRPDEAFKFAAESEASNDNGITVLGRILSVAREHDSTSILRPCSPIPAELRYEVTDVNSLHYRSKYNPGFYVLNKKIHVRPAAAGSDNDMKVSQIVYATTNFNQDAISDFPDEYEELISIYAAAQSCLAASGNIQNNMPTKPEAPTAPSFESVHFEVELPAEPIYSPPVLELSQFNFESIRTHILKGDFDMADKLLGVVDKKVEEYEKQEKQEKQNYDRMQKIFDTKLQTLEKNKEREFNIKAGDYRSQIYKYQYDINEYQSELQEITTKYKWFMEQYVTLMNEYNKGISSVPAPVQGPRGQGQIQAKPAKEPEGGE